MRKGVVFFCLVVAQTAPLSGQTGRVADHPVDAKVRAELETAREAVWRAWFAGDSAALTRLIPPALAAGSASGWEDRPASIANAQRSAAAGVRLLEIRFDSSTTTLKGHTAVMQARFTYVLEAPGGQRRTVSGRATEVFVRQNDRWVNPFWYLE